MCLLKISFTHNWLKVAKQRTESPPLPLQEEFITASLNQPKASSLEVFISYSRADSDLARRLNESLISLGKLTWFDQESIASGEDFRREIYQGIEISDNFVFIISPKSINSPYCYDEVEYAKKLNKRIITILHQKVAAKDLPPALASVQWLDFSQHGGDFLTNFTQLVRTIHTDRDHVHNHSKWLQRAKEWENSQKSADLLLRGSEFVLAQTWLKKIEQQNKQPPATELHKEFIQASQTAIEAAETAEKERQQQLLKLQQERTQEAEKRLEQEKKNARRQKQWLVVVSLFGAVATCLGFFAASEYRRAAISEIVAVNRTSQASFAPLRVLPSTLINSPFVLSFTASIQLIKHICNASGFSLPNNLSNVSTDGMPLANSKNVFNHSSFSRPYSTISTKLSAPQITPQIVMINISISLCKIECSALGSRKLPKWVSISAAGLFWGDIFDFSF